MPENETIQSTANLSVYLPYLVSVICAIISGVTSYVVARKQTKSDIQKLEKEHELNIEKVRETHRLEKEKMEIEHRHQLELKQKELENALNQSLTNTVLTEALKLPEVRQQLGQGVKSGLKEKHH